MKPYFLDDDYPEIVVVLKRESKRIPGQYDRIVWHKTEQRFIYGDPEEYMVFHGEDSEPTLDVSIKIQNVIKDSYKTGLTQCGSSFYDDGTKLYEVADTAKEHKLIFDASKLD
ncbi:MAG: hypothetical protein IJZ42_04490 [Lachnospiraceae bacterium]|nr:hypothetical protein [Lachnospiraceae bacterium]